MKTSVALLLLSAYFLHFISLFSPSYFLVKCDSNCSNPCPGSHKVMTDCRESECRPTKCSQVGYGLQCTLDDPTCTKGCICDEGYVEDCNGNCIEPADCPSCGGSVNMTMGCGNHCFDNCIEQQACSQSCMANGCQCRTGYCYDTASKSCIKGKST